MTAAGALSVAAAAARTGAGSVRMLSPDACTPPCAAITTAPATAADLPTVSLQVAGLLLDIAAAALTVTCVGRFEAFAAAAQLALLCDGAAKATTPRPLANAGGGNSTGAPAAACCCAAAAAASGHGPVCRSNTQSKQQGACTSTGRASAAAGAGCAAAGCCSLAEAGRTQGLSLSLESCDASNSTAVYPASEAASSIKSSKLVGL